MTMATLSGTINDSPWADLKDQREATHFSMDQESGIQREEEERDSQQQQQQQESSSECSWMVRRLLVRLSLAIDFLLGLFLLVYGFLLRNNEACPKTAVGLILTIGTILLIRSLSGILAASTEFCSRCGLLLSANLSPILSFIFFIMSMIALLGRKMILRYLHQDSLKEFQLLQFCREHYRYVWLVLLTWSILECARWQLFQSYRRQLIRRDDNDDGPTPWRRRASAARPWWWSLTPRRYGEGLSDPLLDDDDIPQWVSDGRRAYHQQSGVSPRRRRRGDNNSNNRRSWLFFWQTQDDAQDDGSVDFASVQEEWASRTEEDPLWWTRDEETKDDDRGDSLSWVTDKDHSGEDVLTSNEQNESQ